MNSLYCSVVPIAKDDFPLYLIVLKCMNFINFMLYKDNDDLLSQIQTEFELFKVSLLLCKFCKFKSCVVKCKTWQ